MFYYFPDNYTWSSAVMLSIMAGGQLGQIDRWLARLRNGEPDIHAWTTAWDNAAAHQEEHAEHDLRQGFRRSASARYLRASTYYLTGERQTPPGPAKSRSYAAALQSFATANLYSPHPIERVEINTMEQALNRVKQWTLADALPHLTQPLLIVHGDHDQAIPVQDARRAHAAAGSGDKQLRSSLKPKADPNTSTPTTPTPHANSSPTGSPTG